MWRARCKFRDFDGTLHDVTRWGKTRREVEAKMNAALADLRSGGPDAPLKPSMPFVDAGRYWLTQAKRPDANKSARTLEAYEGAWNRYLAVEGCPLRGLTLAQANNVQLVLAVLQDVAEQHGSGAAKMARTVVSSVFEMGVRRGVLDANAARSVGAVKASRPKVSKRDKRRSLTPDERGDVIEAADARAAKPGDPRSLRKWQTVADLVAFLAGTGVRISEARLLRWESLDLETGVVQIEGTKTISSRRTLNLPEWLRGRMAVRAARVGTSGYVFAAPALLDEDGATPMDASNLAGWVRVVFDDAGLSWATSHTFRRTVATMLHENGAPLVRIADQLGHANPTMTANVYLGRDLRGDKADLAALL
jgi:integrase